MRELGIGLIGTGFMGKAHAFAYRSALAAFPDIPVPRLEMIADVEAAQAAKAAQQFGFARSTSNWRDLVNDPRIDVAIVGDDARLAAGEADGIAAEFANGY